VGFAQIVFLEIIFPSLSGQHWGGMVFHRQCSLNSTQPSHISNVLPAEADERLERELAADLVLADPALSSIRGYSSFLSGRNQPLAWVFFYWRKEPGLINLAAIPLLW